MDDRDSIGGHCASGLRCCGICFGCYNGVDCSQKHCDLLGSNTLRSKKTLLRPLWFLNYYQRQEDQDRSADIFEQQQQNQKDQEQQQEIQQQMQQISPARYSVSYKPFTYIRPKNYPLNSLEYIIAPEN